MTRNYPLGNAFPSESFVQAAIERHFLALGFEINAAGDVDLVCTHAISGQRWQIEAKGRTSDCGLDFRTALGQLIQGMTLPDHRYAIALPDVPQYRAQIARIKPWVIQRLQLHWLFVDTAGAVTLVVPSELANTAKGID